MGDERYVVTVHPFGAEISGELLIIGEEHVETRWLAYDAASARLAVHQQPNCIVGAQPTNPGGRLRLLSQDPDAGKLIVWPGRGSTQVVTSCPHGKPRARCILKGRSYGPGVLPHPVLIRRSASLDSPSTPLLPGWSRAGDTPATWSKNGADHDHAPPDLLTLLSSHVCSWAASSLFRFPAPSRAQTNTGTTGRCEQEPGVQLFLDWDVRPASYVHV